MLYLLYRDLPLFSGCCCNKNYLLFSTINNNSYFSNAHLKIVNEILKQYKIVLFMKGTAREPKCKYSRRGLDLLKCAKAEIIKTVNIMEDEGIKNAIKSISGWPTFPQLFVNGRFIGGVDLIEEMYSDGRLQKIFQS